MNESAVWDTTQPPEAIHHLADRLGRVHRALRISVTDACNIRCQYCMPAHGAQFLPQNRLLPFDAIERFVHIVAGMGIRKIRITGGEPLMRPRLEELIARLARIDEINDLALTTNGMMLAAQLPALVAAGLQRVNISLDTLREATFKQLARREGLNQVLEGIEATKSYSQLKVRLNSLVLRQINFEEVVELVEFARLHHLPLRFIEFMPLDAEHAWDKQRMVSGAELRSLIESKFGPLQAIEADPSQPSQDFRFADGQGVIGFIDSVSQPFCQSCDRLRLTAEGKLRNCLFGHQEWNLAPLLSTGDDLQVSQMVRDCVQHKHPAHGINDPNFKQPERAMYRIGG